MVCTPIELSDRAFQLVCSTRTLTLIAESAADKATWKEAVSLAILNRRGAPPDTHMHTLTHSLTHTQSHSNTLTLTLTLTHNMPSADSAASAGL